MRDCKSFGHFRPTSACGCTCRSHIDETFAWAYCTAQLATNCHFNQPYREDYKRRNEPDNIIKIYANSTNTPLARREIGCFLSGTPALKQAVRDHWPKQEEREGAAEI
jgi:hypothetical protein